MNGRHHGYEDEQLGKALDFRLLRRVVRFARPYRLLFVLAFLLAGGITVIELALPYLVKTAVDSVLVLPWIEVRADVPPVEGALPYDPGTFLVNEQTLADPVRQALEEEGRVLRRFLVVPADVAAAELVARYSHLFRLTPVGYAAPEEALQDIPSLDLLRLRASAVELLGFLALAYVGFLVVRFLLTYGQVYTIQYAGQKILYDMRRAVFGNLLLLPMSYLDRQPVGRLVTRATNDVAAINVMFTQVLVRLLRDLLIIAGVLGVMFHLNVRLTLILLAFTPFILVLAFWFRKRAREAYSAARRVLARINAYIAESLSGMEIIQLFRQEERSRQAFADINRRFFRAQMRSITVYGVFGPVISVMQNIALALLIWYGGRGVLAGAFTLGALVAFTSYIRMLFQPMVNLSEQYNILQAAMVAAERIFAILDEKPEPTGTRTIPILHGELEFRDVWFAYNDEEWVLQNVSFHVAPGERVAIVGPTGSGKTTIVGLALGFYRPQKGAILVDGVDLAELDLQDYRRKLALVPQEVFLFSGDVAENIRMWDGVVPSEAAEGAAKAVGVHDHLARLPEGYRTQVKERGVRLSVGERQLLSLARAVAADPKFIVLDEATANIDSQTEAQVQEALERVMAGRTAIAIAHRLSTIRNVDRVLVIHEGKLVEEGPVEALLARKGLFWALWQLQFASGESPSPAAG
ncbi:MAG TPA: ABC transporter ATP-binding protein [Candidatus Acetothermia bacterium]|nr:ABC transporter ATP-binding protein [Candidatus Acetothermia bacterium]